MSTTVTIFRTNDVNGLKLQNLLLKEKNLNESFFIRESLPRGEIHLGKLVGRKNKVSGKPFMFLEGIIFHPIKGFKYTKITDPIISEVFFNKTNNRYFITCKGATYRAAKDVF